MDIINKPRKQKRMADGLKEGLEQAVEMSKVVDSSNEEVKTDFLGRLIVGEGLTSQGYNIEAVELTHVALGTFKDSSGQWNLVKIQYNPEAGVVGQLTSTIEGEKSSAVDRFKIEAVNNKII